MISAGVWKGTSSLDARMMEKSWFVILDQECLENSSMKERRNRFYSPTMEKLSSENSKREIE